jgi:predicted transcriptional regulator of viral defense system
MQPKDKLREIAMRQAGFFTAAQATAAGYPDSLHVYHTREGHWEKVYRGIYRLADAPRIEHPELVVWSLWSRNRNGAPQLVYSHETAEMILGLRPWTPGPLHATVPRSFRKNCAVPKELILHKEDIPPEEIEWREGFAVRRPIGSPPRVFKAAYDRAIAAGED